METAPIIGHQRVLKFFEQAVANDQVGHAYLFLGSPKLGKAAVAKWLAKLLVGDSKQAERNIIFTRPEAGIKIADIRSLKHELSLSNPLGGRRVMILGNIDEMPVEAQNAFLKILEEPQTQVVFILLAQKLAGILPTIISRTQLVRFSPVAGDEIKQALEQQGVATETAIKLTRLSRGRPEWAREQAKSDSNLSDLENRAREFTSLFKSALVKRFALAKQVAESANPHVYIETWEGVLRDILLCQQGEAGQVTNVFLQKELGTMARNISVAETSAALRGINELRSRLMRNVNNKLAFESYMISYLPS